MSNLHALEYRVISAILRSGSMSDALGSGLKAVHFRSPEPRAIYRFIEDHWYHPRTRNEIPLLETIRTRFPGFALVDEDPSYAPQLRTMIHELKIQALGSDIRSLAAVMLEMNEEDPEQALRQIKAKLFDIDFKFEPSRGIGIQEIVEGTKAIYAGALDGSIRGIPWPWDCLTDDTGGKKGGDFIVFYGRMKSMKTWLLLKSAADDFLKYNQRVYIWSKEMSEDKLKLRLGSILANVDYQLLKNGSLPKRIAEKAFAQLDQLASMMSRTDQQIKDNGLLGTRDMIIQCGPRAPRDITGLSNAINEFKPSVVYLDSFYHLQSPRVSDGAQIWHKITVLAESLKELAMEHDVPIVVAAQANRMGDKSLGSNLSEVAGADAIAREADLIMRIVKRRTGKPLQESDYEVELAREKFTLGRKSLIAKRSDISQYEPAPRFGAELVVVLGGNREGVLEAFSVHAVPGYNFEVIDASFDVSAIHDWAGQGQDELKNNMERKILTRTQGKNQFRL